MVSSGHKFSLEQYYETDIGNAGPETENYQPGQREKKLKEDFPLLKDDSPAMRAVRGADYVDRRKRDEAGVPLPEGYTGTVPEEGSVSSGEEAPGASNPTVTRVDSFGNSYEIPKYIAAMSPEERERAALKAQQDAERKTNQEHDV